MSAGGRYGTQGRSPWLSDAKQEGRALGFLAVRDRRAEESRVCSPGQGAG